MSSPVYMAGSSGSYAEADLLLVAAGNNSTVTTMPSGAGVWVANEQSVSSLDENSGFAPEGDLSKLDALQRSNVFKLLASSTTRIS